jgi:hypothetical protein
MAVDFRDIGFGDVALGIRGGEAMKTFKILAAAMTLALVAAPAAAQFGGKRNGPPAEEKTDPKAARRSAADERAYKAALERIPDAKEKYDPWGGVVPADSPKKPK